MHKQSFAQVPEWIDVCKHVSMKHTEVMMPTAYRKDKAGDILDFVILKNPMKRSRPTIN